MISGHKPGDNITIMNTQFWRAQMDNGKYKDFLTLVYKDCDSGLKYVEEIENPDYIYYLAKPDNRVTYPRLFIEEEHAEPIYVKYKDLEKDIAKRVGLSEFFYQNATNGNRSENKKLHLHPDVFNSDMNIEDHYMHRFSRMYKNEPCSITKAFFDIESDTISMIGDFPEPGECPINAISLILQEQKQIYVFLLRNPANPQIQKFEDEVKSGSIYEELNNFIVDAVGGPTVAEKYKVDFKFKFLFYDPENEILLIKDLFNAINAFKPDFALAWNMGFDVPYIIARIQRLGYNPEDIICNKDFTNKIARYYIDERNKSDFAERGDFAQIASYTVFLDQMIHFASRRKGQSRFISFTLDYIGEVVAGVRKLDYKHITTNISELPYKDYKTFVFYNIMDTMVQYCIEVCTGDIDYVFTKSNINCTRYCKAHRQTVYLTNRVTKDIRNNGFIIGNNTNKFNPKPTEKFPGAFVADPRQLSDYARITIFGIPINCFDNADDFDYASLYPSIIREFNIAPNTQIGRLLIDGEITHAQMSQYNNSLAGAFMEDIQSQNWIEFACRWFNLADYTTLYHEVEWFFTNVMNPIFGLRVYNRDGHIIPMVDIKHDNKIFPMEFYGTPKAIDENGFSVEFYQNNIIDDKYIKPDLNEWERRRAYAIEHPNQQF